MVIDVQSLINRPLDHTHKLNGGPRFKTSDNVENAVAITFKLFYMHLFFGTTENAGPNDRKWKCRTRNVEAET